jgi:hypothetical protein
VTAVVSGLAAASAARAGAETARPDAAAIHAAVEANKRTRDLMSDMISPTLS